MNKTHTRTVTVATGQDQPILSKAQQTFNKLIKQIESKRASLSDWEAAIPRYRQKYASDLLPLIDELMDKQIRLLHGLDSASEQKGFSKAERSEISRIIRYVAGQVLSRRDDEELKALYNKHGRSDYDSEKASDLEDVKSMMEDILGVDLGDDLDMSSPEELFRRVQEQAESKQGNRPRKKSAKQTAKEAQQKIEEQQVSQSIREVYKKLASALHPDREPEVQERERKTSLMQRVNQAYEKKDLLQLLKLQLELEHIDQAALNNIGEERLKHYNKILKEQLAELDREIWHVEGEFRAQFGMSPFGRVTQDTLMQNLGREIVELRHAIRTAEIDLRAFDDVKKIKAWLKAMKRQSEAMDDFGDCPF